MTQLAQPPSEAPPRRFRGVSRRSIALGVVASIVILVALASLVSLATRPFQSGDENEHVGYALEVGSLHLPTLDTRVPPRIPGMYADRMYTANHPPLFYAIEAVPLRLGLAAGRPLVGLHAARLVNTAIAALGLLALAGLAQVVFPGRPATWVIAPAVLAPVPLAVAVSGQVYNDALAGTTAVATLLCCALILLRGPSRKRLALLAVAALLVSASRATGLEVAALACVSAVLSVLLHRPAATARLAGFGRAVVAGSVVAASVVVGIGWFYLRNRHLYGDLTGARVTVESFGLRPVPISQTAPSRDFWWTQYLGLFGRARLMTDWPRLGLQLLGLLFLAAGVLAAGGAVRAVRERRLRPPQLAVAAVFGLHVVFSLATLVIYVSQGGAPIPRYLLSALPVLVLVIAYGLDVLPAALRATATLLAVAGTAVVGLAIGARELAYRNPGLRHRSLLRTQVDALHAGGVPAPTAVLAVLLVLLVAAIVVVALSVATRQGDRAGRAQVRDP